MAAEGSSDSEEGALRLVRSSGKTYDIVPDALDGLARMNLPVFETAMVRFDMHRCMSHPDHPIVSITTLSLQLFLTSEGGIHQCVTHICMSSHYTNV